MAKIVAPERVVDQKLYDLMATLQQAKEDIAALYTNYKKQGVPVFKGDKEGVCTDLNNCIGSLGILASLKYDFDLQKGGLS